MLTLLHNTAVKLADTRRMFGSLRLSVVGLFLLWYRIYVSSYPLKITTVIQTPTLYLWLLEEAREFRLDFRIDELLDYAGVIVLLERNKRGCSLAYAKASNTMDLYMYLAYITSRLDSALWSRPLRKACRRWNIKQALRGRDPILIDYHLKELFSENSNKHEKSNSNGSRRA